tara:strand:+ start:5298 stop:5498 length:201 start_codon:yes stop_codon:yes gene_type:complete
MLKQPQLIEALELAKKGAFRKENIIALIKADFFNEYNSAKSLMNLYSKLGTRYGMSQSKIRSICCN